MSQSNLLYARVSVNLTAVSGVFDYHVPPEMQDNLRPGCLVVVPFGEQKVQGIVVDMPDTPQVSETRPIQTLLDPHPVVTPTQIELAQSLSASQLAPLPACLNAMLPPGLSRLADTLFQLVEIKPATPLNPSQQQLQSLLEHSGELRGRQLDRRLMNRDWRHAMRALVQKGVVKATPVLPPPSVRPKIVRTARIHATPEQVEAMGNSLGRGAAAQRRQRILDFLLREAWEVDVDWVYANAPGANLQDLRLLEGLDLIRLGENEVWRDPLDDLHFELSVAPALDQQQTAVWASIRAALTQPDPPAPVILQGVTGSGKTEIYLRAVQAVLEKNQSAIILIPEISLTPQTVRRFAGRFPGKVGLVHSRLSAGERYDTWRRARSGDLSVIIGARSALFSPCPRLGLIVVDEFDDPAYHQHDSQFSYHAVRAALEYARLAGALVLMGSATPDVSLRCHAEQHGWQVLRMPRRILAHRDTVNAHLKQIGAKTLPTGSSPTTANALPPVQVVDMRDELKLGNSTIFSLALQEELRAVLERNEQAILYLNRRGSATYVFCRECGSPLQCPHCEKNLVYHQGAEKLRCHTCNYQRGMPERCPVCGSIRIRAYGTGTEKVELFVRQLFPAARVLRYDHESTRQKTAHEIIFAHFANHRADILVGTQMLGKGLDLPLVTLVGVVLADVGLNLPDFSANERVFHMLTQVAGRAGRSPLGGKVILQTFDPQHYVIQHAANHDVDGFYHDELSYRRQMAYPPFSRLLRLETRSTNPDAAEGQARQLAEQLRQWLTDGKHHETHLIGPVPCYFHKVAGQYRWQVVLRGPEPAAIVRPHLPLPDWTIEVDPPSLL